MRAANHTLVNLGRLQLFSAYFSLNLESRSVTKVLPLVAELERSNGSSLRGCLVSFLYWPLWRIRSGFGRIAQIASGAGLTRIPVAPPCFLFFWRGINAYFPTLPPFCRSIRIIGLGGVSRQIIDSKGRIFKIIHK
jgi:hypothetical protein